MKRIGLSLKSIAPHDDVEKRLDNGETPLAIVHSGVPVEMLYGKKYNEGLIFFIDTENKYDFEVLVAEVQDSLGDAHWGCYKTTINGLSEIEFNYSKEDGPKIVKTDNLGDGIKNTNATIQQCTEENTAAKLCRALGENWFLPSLLELNLMFKNLHVSNKVFHAPKGAWWSSSQQTDGKGYFFDLKTGVFGSKYKDLDLHVRAVGAF